MMDLLNMVGPHPLALVSARGRPRWKMVMFRKGDL
jgi:hypothetical protein